MASSRPHFHQLQELLLTKFSHFAPRRTGCCCLCHMFEKTWFFLELGLFTMFFKDACTDLWTQDSKQSVCQNCSIPFWKQIRTWLQCSAFLQLSKNEDHLEVNISAGVLSWFVLPSTSHLPTFTSSPVSCILYPVSILCPALKCTSMHFLSQHQGFLQKARQCQRGPLLDISYPFLWGTFLQTLDFPPDISPLHMECERWLMPRGQEPGTRNCANPVHWLSVLSCARVLTPTTQTLAGKSAADGSVWDPEVTRSPSMVRLHCCVGSSKKTQGWDERQIGAQGWH